MLTKDTITPQEVEALTLLWDRIHNSPSSELPASGNTSTNTAIRHVHHYLDILKARGKDPVKSVRDRAPSWKTLEKISDIFGRDIPTSILFSEWDFLLFQTFLHKKDKFIPSIHESQFWGFALDFWVRCRDHYPNESFEVRKEISELMYPVYVFDNLVEEHGYEDIENLIDATFFYFE